jgi:phosphopantothenoylcysteine decarboxylase/phosphopantothenate--cysteine ligase
MHEPMYDHPGVTDAMDRLTEWDVDIVPPRIEEGKAKIAGEEAIALAVARAATDDPLAGSRVVVTSGGTAEPVDPVRVLATRASGRTGRAVAKACYVAGAAVTLVHPDGDVPYADVEQTETAAEMTAAAVDAAADADALVSAAAVGDFTLEERSEKIRSGEPVTLDLEPTPKLLDTVREKFPGLPMVGFKAEAGGDDDAMAERARDLRDRVGLAFVVANDASVMGAEETRALVVDDDVDTYEGSKAGLGRRVAAELAGAL